MKQYPKWFGPVWTIGLFLMLAVFVICFSHFTKISGGWYYAGAHDFFGLSCWYLPTEIAKQTPRTRIRAIILALVVMICITLSLFVVVLNLLSLLS